MLRRTVTFRARKGTPGSFVDGAVEEEEVVKVSCNQC